jgi:hypothetical protein
MKKMICMLGLLATTLCSVNVSAQKVKNISGSTDILKSETAINIEFVYENISVGKYKNEKDYIAAKTEEYNKKEPGKGDSWAKSWETDKANRYEPRFIDLFKINSGMTVQTDAKYTIIIKPISFEPGYNVGISRKNAEIDVEISVVETANRSNTVALLTINNVPGGTAFGYDFDTGLRISEAYANAGKKLAKFIK